MIDAAVTFLIGAIIALITVKTSMVFFGKHVRKKGTELTPLNVADKTANLEPLTVAIQELQFEKKDLKRKVTKRRGEPVRKYVLALLVFGVIALISAIAFTSYILALVGLGLTFWGILFLFIRPVSYVKSSLVDSSIVPSLTILDRMLAQLNYQGDAVYLPPKSLEGTKEGVIFIGAKKESAMPTMEEVPQGNVFINPHGMYLIPPGQGLVNLFEEKLGTDLFKTDLYYLQSSLPRLFTEDLELAKDFDMDINGDIVHVRIKGSVYSNVCSEVRKLANICCRVGCPLCSAIAYALAKASGKAVRIEKNEFHEDEIVETWYRLFDVSKV
jgi:hypothetical protein